MGTQFNQDDMKQTDWMEKMLFESDEADIDIKLAEAKEYVRNFFMEATREVGDLYSHKTFSSTEGKCFYRMTMKRCFIIFCVLSVPSYRKLIRDRCNRQKFNAFISTFPDHVDQFFGGTSHIQRPNAPVIPKYDNSFELLTMVVVGYPSGSYVVVIKK